MWRNNNLKHLQVKKVRNGWIVVFDNSFDLVDLDTIKLLNTAKNKRGNHEIKGESFS